MLMYTKMRSSYIIQSVIHLCQRNCVIYKTGFLKNVSSRALCSSNALPTESETSLISETATDSITISKSALQSHLDRYNDRRIIFNSITYKPDPDPSYSRRRIRQQLKAEKLFASESIIYQRLKNIEKCENEVTDVHLNETIVHQNLNRSNINQCLDDSPVSVTTDRTNVNNESNLNSLIENDCSNHLHSNESLEKGVVGSECAAIKSVPVIQDSISEYENQDPDKSNEKIVIGSADESVPKSCVPCGGCGALQHCQDPGLPGFKPYEKFVGRTDDELRLTVCYRCHFLTGFDLAVPSAHSPQSYELLEPVKSPDSLVLLVVDLTDAPCSIHPKTLQIIDRSQPVIIVGNKVDLLPLTGPDCLERAYKALYLLIQNTLLAKANIVDACFVSGHTGYGVENLISSVFKHWHKKGKFLGDVFLVGCTNSGKSTLFNMLMQSDLSDQHADMCSLRSTVSTWPATTVDMVKFPMLLWTPRHSHMAGFGENVPPPVQYLRIKRLERAHEEIKQQAAIEPSLQFTRDPMFATLTDKVGRTNVMDGPPPRSNRPPIQGDNIRVAQRKMRKLEAEEVMNYNPDAKVYGGHKYCYDTPGLVQPHQLLGLLTQEELRLVLPDRLIVPETFRLRPGMSLFVGGLARLDVLHLHHDLTLSTRSRDYVKVTVFRSRALPVSIVKTVAASSFFRDYLGSSLLRVPMGSASRLQQWPALKCNNITAVGEAKIEADADVVLSSAGWVSLNLSPGTECSLRAWTPGGRGAFLRVPSFLPLAGTKSQCLSKNSVVYSSNWLYVTQPKLELLSESEVDENLVTHFPAIAGPCSNSNLFLQQTSPQTSLPEISDEVYLPNPNEQCDSSDFPTSHKLQNS